MLVVISILLGFAFIKIPYYNNNNVERGNCSSTSIWSRVFFHKDDMMEKQNQEEPHTFGVNLGSWLNLEDFFHTTAKFKRDVSLGFGGGRLWPVLNYDNMSSVLSDEKGWSSEADLVGKLIKMYGVHRAVQIVHEYRETYYIEQDFQEMKTHGIKQIRLPMGWWALMDPDVDGLESCTQNSHSRCTTNE